MNHLPNDVEMLIYYYKNNLEYIDVLNELLQAKINVFYNISLKQSRIMCYVINNKKYSSTNVNDLNVSSSQLLNTIKLKNKYFNYFFIIIFIFVNI